MPEHIQRSFESHAFSDHAQNMLTLLNIFDSRTFFENSVSRVDIYLYQLSSSLGFLSNPHISHMSCGSAD